MTRTRAWLRWILAEARSAQDDPARDAAFQAWKVRFVADQKKKRGGGRGKLNIPQVPRKNNRSTGDEECSSVVEDGETT